MDDPLPDNFCIKCTAGELIVETMKMVIKVCSSLNSWKTYANPAESRETTSIQC